MANIFTDEFTDSALGSNAVFENFAPLSGEPGIEIVFVMGDLPDRQALIAGIKPGIEISLLDSQGDGIAQMLSILDGRSGIDAIHIFSHGASGSLSLGSTTLNSNTFLDHQSQLAELGSHLRSTGDLLLYACNVAQGADGQAFIESISRTTGADVAASTDLTGATASGGDWVLEASAGVVDASTVLSVTDYTGIFATGASDPVFPTSVTNPFGLSDVGSFAQPTLVDIDGDGDLDAFVGNKSGETRFYRNTGSASSVAFASAVTNPFGLTDVGSNASPTFVDIDGDGDLDAFVGKNDGNTLFFLNAGSASSATFAVAVTNPFGLKDVGLYATPTFVDINGDGALDAFIGNGSGNTLFFRNMGSASSATFSTAQTNPFGLIDVGTSASPTFVDIDGNGALDAFVGNEDGNTLFLRNTGSAGSAAFASAETNPFGLIDVGSYASPTFADIDGDGDLDAFVGKKDGNMFFLQNIHIKITQTNGTTAVTEGAATDSYTVVLTVAPTADVVITLDDTNGQVSFDKPVLTFTSANWNIAQTVTVTAVNDTVGEGRHTGVIHHTATSLDANYNSSLVANLLVAVSDNDLRASDPVFPTSGQDLFGLIDVGSFAQPTLVDIDGDGALDAFIGNKDGNTLFFRNTGNASSVAFASAVTNPFDLTDVGAYASPTFADIDGDGDLDAFVGKSDGNTLFFRNTGSASSATFAVAVTNPFGLSDVGSYAAPTLVDIDGDGDLDAFVGNEDGNTLFFRNTGSASSAAFASAETNPFGLTNVGVSANPTFVDIDGNGALDAFVGNKDGNTLLLRNTGSASSAAFASAETNPFGLKDVGMYARPTLVDIDGDGDLDAFVGNNNGHTLFFGNAPATTVSTVSFSADTGTSETDFITKTAAQTISGTLSANLIVGELVKVSLNNGSTSAVASAAVGSAAWSLPGVTLAASNTLKVWVEDASGNKGAIKTQAYTLDSTAPTVASVTTTGTGIMNGSGALDVGSVVTVTLNTSEAVTVNTTGGTPTISLSDGGSATYAGGSGTTSLTFTHTVSAGQNTPDLRVTAFNADGALLTDTAGSALNTTGAVANPSGTLVVDTTPLTATITAVTPDPRNTSAGVVNVVFNKVATGVDITDFILTRGGSVVDISSAPFSGSGSSYSIDLTDVTLTEGAWVLTLKSTGTDIKNTLGDDFLGGATESFTVDTTPPTARVDAITAISADSDFGTATDFATITANQTITGSFTGSLNAGEKFQISANGGSTWVDATAGSGTWSAAGVTLSSGTWVLSSRTLDLAGNVLAGATHAYTLQLPAPYSIVRQSPTFSTTNADVVNFRVTFTTAVQGVAGTDFSLTPGSLDGATVQLVTPVLNSNGIQYDVQVGGLAGRTGSVNLDIATANTITEVALTNGVHRTLSSLLPSSGIDETFTVDHFILPATLAISLDTGASASDLITSCTTLVFSGTTEVGNAVRLILKESNDATVFSVDASILGTSWSYDRSSLPLEAGSYTLSLITSDQADNTATTTREIIIDTSAPVRSSASVDGTILTIAYTDATSLNAANSLLPNAFTVKADGKSTPLTVNAVQVNASAKTVTLTLAVPVLATDTITVAYADPGSGALEDLAGNHADSFDTLTCTNFSAASDEAPVISNVSGATWFNKGDDPVQVFNGTTPLLITDADDAYLESVSVTMTTNRQTTDMLSVLGALPTGITAGTYNADSGLLKLTGHALIADYQNALSQVCFSNSAGTAMDVDRTITLTANDGQRESAAVTRTLRVLGPDFSTEASAVSYMVGNATGTTAMDLSAVNLVTGTISYQAKDFWANATNALGFSSVDGHLYAVDNVTHKIIRINSDNTVTVMTPAFSGGNAPNAGWYFYAADISSSGVMYLISGAKAYRFDVNPSSNNYLTWLAPLTVRNTGTTDFGFNPVDGQIYAATSHLWRINPVSGATTDLGVLTSSGSGSYWGQYFDTNGYFYLTSGGANPVIYRVDVSNPGAPNLTATPIRYSTRLPTSGDGALVVRIQLDYGDAPDSYATSLAADGARHNTQGNVTWMGTAPGYEADGPANGTGSSDTDDGVTSFSSLSSNYTSYSVDVNVTNLSARPAVLVGWIDFNRDGMFQTDEGVSVSVAAGFSGIKTVTWSGLSGLSAGTTYARFRIGTDTATLKASYAKGALMDGEVEDYQLTLLAPDATPPTASFGAITPDPRHRVVGPVTLNFSENVTGVDIGDFTLTRDGISVSLSGATLIGSGKVYTIDLSSVTNPAGSWLLTLKSSDTGIADQVGNLLTTGVSSSFVMDTTAPMIDLSPTVASQFGYTVTSVNGALVSLDDNSNPATFVEASDKISKITITVDGLRDGASELISFGSKEVRADGGSGNQSSITVGGVSVDIVCSQGLFTLTQHDGAVLTQAQVQAIICDLQYRDTAVPQAGLRTFSFSATDLAGVEANPATTTIRVTDTTSLAVPVIIGISTDTGTVGDQSTGDTTLVFIGTAAANSTVTVYVDSVEKGTTLTDANGNWSFDYTGTVLVNGVYTLKASATGFGSSADYLLTINTTDVDRTFPAVPTVKSLTASSTTPTVTGTANLAAGELLSVVVNGIIYTEGDGNLNRTSTNWSLVIPAGHALAKGFYDVTARVTDLAGNVSSDTTSKELLVPGDTGVVTITRGLQAGSTATITVTDSDLNNDSGSPQTLDVMVVNSSTGENETVTLTETGNNTGIFSSTLATSNNSAAGTNNNGNLNVAAGQSVTVTYTDAFDGVGAVNQIRTASVDVLMAGAPAQMVTIGTMTKDTGTSSTDFITNDGSANRTVSGAISSALTVSQFVEVSFDGGLAWATASTTGTSWSISDSVIHNGNWAIKARVSDAGVTGAITTRSVTLDTVSPSASLALDSVTADDVLNINEAADLVAITGTAGGDIQADNIITLTVNGANYTGTVKADHSFSISVPGNILSTDGDQTIDASATAVTDEAGNSTVATVNRTCTKDLIAPLPTMTVNSVTADNLLNIDETAGTVTLSGSVDSEVQIGNTVTLMINGTAYTGAVLSDRTYRITVPGFALGADSDLKIDASVTTADGAGNSATALATRVFSVDVTPPTVSIALDNVTTDSTLNPEEIAGTVAITGTVTGEFTEGDLVTLIVGDTNYTGAVVSGGSFSINVPGSELNAAASLMVGAFVTANDAAGNSTTAMTDKVYSVDITPPVAVSATIDAKSLVLSFSDASLLDGTNIPVTGVFAVTADGVADSVTGVAVDAQAKTVTLTLATAVNAATVVNVTYTDPATGNDANAVQDSVGNDADTFTISSVTNKTANVKPTVDLTGTGDGNSAATFTELNGGDTGANAVSFTAGATNITDIDSAHLANVTVTLPTASAVTGDQLLLGTTVINLASATGSGTVIYNGTVFAYTVADVSGARTIKFTSRNAGNSADAVAARASYEALIDALKYNNTSDTPSGTRVFSVTANDNALDSTAATFTVTLAATNDSPTVDLNTGTPGINNQLSFIFGTPLNFSAGGANIADLDTATLSTLTITFAGSTILDGASEQLKFASGPTTTIALNALSAGTLSTAINGIIYAYAVTGTTDKTVTFTNSGGGTVSLEQAESLLDTLQYNNTNATPTAGARLFNVTVNDGNSSSPLSTFTAAVSLSPPVVNLNGSGSDINKSANFIEVWGTDNGTDALNFTTGGANIASGGSLANLKVSMAIAGIGSGDQLLLGGSVINLDSVASPGSASYNGTTFKYAVADAGGSRMVTFTSRNAENTADAVALNASYEALIDALKYNNTSDTPVNGSSRILSVTAFDGTLESAVATFTVTLTATNDQAPDITSVPENSSGSINAAEADDGTVVKVSLTNTGAEAGNLLHLVWAGQTAVDYTLQQSDIVAGTAAVTIPAATISAGGEGAGNITAQINTGLVSALFPVLVDKTAPTAPVITDVAESSSDSIAADLITNDNTQLVTLTGESDGTPKIYTNAGVLVATNQYSFTETGSGTCQIDFGAHTLADGSYSVKLTDAAGNESSASNTFTVDTTSPVLLNATINGSALVLLLADANLLDDINVPLNSAFTVSAGGKNIPVDSYVVSPGEKTITLTLASSVVTGQPVTLTYTDPGAGNDPNAIQDLAGNDFASFTVPLKIVVITSVLDDVSPLTGIVENGGSTNDVAPDLAGTLSTVPGTGDAVAIYRDGSRIGYATTNGTSWTYVDSGLGNGSTHSYTARVENGVLYGTWSGAYGVTVDTMAPTAGTVTANNVTVAGGTSCQFTVAFADVSGSGINSASIGTGDVTVTKSGGGTLTVTNASYSSGTATYTVTPLGGSWDSGDNATYTIALVGSQVADAAGNAVAANASAGSFTVTICTVTAGTATATLVEAGGVSNGTAGIASSSITLIKGAEGTASYDTAAMGTAGWTTSDSGLTYMQTGIYGTATLTLSTDVVSYSLRDSDTDTQALTDSSSVTDSFTVQVTDGMVNAVFSITGANDAAVITGTSTASVTEGNLASDLSASGTLTSTDVDGTANLFTAQSNVAGSNAYGKFSITTAGAWSYTADSAHNEFVGGTSYTDSITVSAADGTTQLITITMTGANDAAVITGTSTASVTEGNLATDLSASGTLISTDLDGTANLFTAQSNVAGSNAYGKFSIDTAGAWSYTADSAHNEFVGGTTYTDSITVSAADGTTQLITITMTGANDAAVITGTSTASVTEGNLASDLAASGTLSSTDVDGTSNLFTAQSNVAGSNSYGKFSIDTAGAWNYTADSAHNEFVGGTSYTDSITVSAADGTTKLITITMTGANDAAVITGTSTASVTEGNLATDLSASGSLTSTNVDGTANLFTAQTNVAGSNAYGKFSITTAGAWSYTADSAHNEFVGGTSYSDSITVSAADGTTQLITVTMTGTNDAAVITGTSTASVTEGNLATDLSASGTLISTDVDGTANLFTAQSNVAGSNAYGKFSIDTAGAWSYTADSAHNEFVGGTSYTDSITVTAADGTTQLITITMTGANDAAVITGTSTASVTEGNLATDLSASGTLISTDVDGTANLFTAQSNVAGSNAYGKFSITTAGAWSYTADSAHNEFVGGTTYTDSITVAAADGTTQLITITMTGANDAAVITGTSTASVTEGNLVTDLAASGTLTSTDVDGTANLFTAQSNVAGSNSYGKFSITTAGAWSYTADSAHNEFVGGTTYTDSIMVEAADGTTQLITITMTGANDAAVITGTSTASVTEGNLATDLSASGTLISTDLDGTANLFTAQSNVAGSNAYGKFSIDIAGAWSYTADSAHNEFVGGTSYTDSITVTAADGTMQLITITMTGANDAAVITGTSTASVTEGNLASDLAASGTLISTDVDGTANLFTAQSNVAGSNAYGKFSIDTAWAWSYTADSAHNEFVGGTTYTDSITVAAADGTTQLITITMTGANDAAVITGTSTASVTEGNLATDLSASGTLISTDLDGTANLFTAQSNVAGSNAYGKFSIDTAGAWSYTADSAHNEFVGGTSYTDSITVAAADGTTQLITITMTGANDAAVITGTSTASVTEGNLTTDLSASGTMTSTDVDGTANLFAAQSNVAGSNAYGKFSIDTAGAWSYTADSAHNEFVGGTTYTDSITVAAADGTTQLITITMTGANDAAVITGTSTASVTEGNLATDLSASGTLISTDLDGTANLFTAQSNVAGSNSYGKFSITTAGAWSYTANSAHNEFVGGTTYTDSITVTAADGTMQLITITMTGTNDAAVITGTSTASVTEGNLATDLAASGTLTSADVDGTANLFTAQSNVAGSNSYGKFSITTAGAWSYTADSVHNEFVGGTSYTDSITVTAEDGTTLLITITMTGANDAAVITGTSTSNVAEGNLASDLSASGTLTSTDLDGTANLFTAQSNVAGSNAYGKFSIDTAGAWSYTADSAHNEFVGGTTYTDSITVSAADGTTQLITITMTGANDAAVITGTSTASVTEGNLATDLSASGTLISTDLDGTANLFTAQSNVAGSNAYGKFSIDTAGAWSYTADSAHNEFVGGTSYTDSITVTAADGTTQLITITMTGANDAAVITGTSTSNVMEGNLATDLSASGSLTSTDVDGTENLFIAQTNVAGSNSYGKFSITTAGAWSYTADSAHNEFVGGTTYTDSITVTAADGTTQLITITMTGANDAAVITGTSTASVTEGNLATDLSASGTLTSTDVDGTENLFIAQTNVAGSNAYGKFSITTAGAWSYTANSAHNEFVGGTTYTDSITVSAADGTTQLITITIIGMNDQPAITGASISAVTEDTSVINNHVTTSGILTISDPDQNQSSFVTQPSYAGIYGTFTLDAAGNWTYSADNTQAAIQQLGVTQSLTDSFVARSLDGTASQAVTVTINGTTDAFVSIGNTTVNEAAGTANFTVTRSDDTHGAITIDYATHDGSALADSDYTAASGTLHFVDGEITKQVSVAITNDTLFEVSESFSVQLLNPSTGVTASNQPGEATIKDDGTGSGGTDNDTPTLNVSHVTLSESSPYVFFTVVLDHASTQAISFTPALHSGTATVGTDTATTLQYFDGTVWQDSAGAITINAGATNVVLRVAVTNDSTYEGAETLTFLADALTGTLTNTTPAEGSVTIEDNGSSTNIFMDGNTSTSPTKGAANDDRPTISISNSTVSEAQPYATVSVSLSNPSTTAVTFTPSLVGNTALPGVDFGSSLEYFNGTNWDAVSGEITISAGTLSVQLRTTLVQDSLFTEGTERFQITTGTILGEVVNQSGTSGAVSITDVLQLSDPVITDITETTPDPTPYDLLTADTSPVLTLNGEAGCSVTLYQKSGVQYTAIKSVAFTTIEQSGIYTLDFGSNNLSHGDYAVQLTKGGYTSGYSDLFTIDSAPGLYDITGRREIVMRSETDAVTQGVVGGFDQNRQHASWNGTNWVDSDGETICFSFDTVSIFDQFSHPTGTVIKTLENGSSLELNVQTGAYIYNPVNTATLDQFTLYASDGKQGSSLELTFDAKDTLDRDGISSIVENGLATLAATVDGVNSTVDLNHDGDLTNDGDLNQDGIADAHQNAVAILAWITADNFDAAKAAENTGDFTNLKVESVISLSIVDSTSGETVDASSQLTNVKVMHAAETTALTGGSKPAGTDWDPIQFTVKPLQSSGLLDADPSRDGTQIRLLLDISRAGQVAGSFIGYEKYVGQAAIDAAIALSDLDGHPITVPGWYDFMQRTAGGDGARFIVENGMITAIELTLTDNAFGDNDMAVGRISDPGVPLTLSATKIYMADQTPGEVDFYGSTIAGSLPLHTWHNTITDDYFYGVDVAQVPYSCYDQQADLGSVMAAGTGVYDVHLFLNSEGDSQLVGESIANARGLLAQGYNDMGALFASAKAVTLDTVAPTVADFSPADNATHVSAGSDIVLTFSEPVTKGTTGKIAIHSVLANGPVVASSITISGNTLTINPTDDLVNDTHYFVTLEDGSVVDLAGNNYAGTSTYDFWTDSPGADPYADGGSSDGSAGTVLGGIAVLGVLAWLAF